MGGPAVLSTARTRKVIGHMINSEQRLAASFIGAVTRDIIVRRGEILQGLSSRAPGARAPASLAAGKVQLESLTSTTADGTEPVTPIGYRTARRSGPLLLSRLDHDDPRLAAARLLQDTAERIGAVRGSSLEKSDHNGGALPDGGVTTKVKHVARYRLIEAVVNGWPVKGAGAGKPGDPLPLLVPLRSLGRRRIIYCFDALRLLVVDGMSQSDILVQHGWPVHSRYRRRLSDGILESLDLVARTVHVRGMV